MILAEYIFHFCAIALFINYLIFPFLMVLCSKKEKLYSPFQPSITIVCAAYNEESVIAEKIASIANSDYPLTKIEVLVGNDNSTDKTKKILDQLSVEYDFLKTFHFHSRTGKPRIIEKLVQASKNQIIISTDANILFASNTIEQLVAPFDNEKIGLVDSVILATNIHKGGISQQEQGYTNIEAKIKNGEGRLFGAMMGPFGGCFAIRKKLFTAIPKNFLVDDFYLCMNVLRQGYKSINNLAAIVYEDISNQTSEEYRRKKRIAAGNFQNLFAFPTLWLNPLNSSFIPFWLHKIIRWFGPFLLVGLLVSNILILFQDHATIFSKIVLIGQLFLYFGAIIDIILKKINIHAVLLRYCTHLVTMNAALAAGFFQYCAGISSSIWEPTKRNQ